MKKVRLLILFVTLLQFCSAQEFLELYGDYLGQKPPGDTPVVFAPGLISKESLEHSSPVFSKDGGEVFWCSKDVPFNVNIKKIWCMKRINNQWTQPQVLDLFDDGLSIGVGSPFLSTDNNRLLVNSVRVDVDKGDLTPDQWTRYTNHDIWLVERNDDGWSSPQSLSPVINSNYIQSQVSITADGTVYYMSYMDGVQNECGIYKSELVDGEYQTPVALPETINSKAQDWTPFIAPDESYLIFSST